MVQRFRGDFGMTLSIPTSGLELDAAITIDLRVAKPDGTVVVWEATANDQSAEYTLEDGDLDQSGLYVGTVHVTYAGPQEKYSSPWYLQVGEHV